VDGGDIDLGTNGSGGFKMGAAGGGGVDLWAT
jgi:hypothetical protein